jgi:hypothetical protein
VFQHLVSRAFGCDLEDLETMTSHPNGHFPANLPILSGKNYDNWCKQMKAVFCYQDLWNLVTEGVPSIGARATDEEKAAHKELKKKVYQKTQRK